MSINLVFHSKSYSYPFSHIFIVDFILGLPFLDGQRFFGSNPKYALLRHNMFILISMIKMEVVRKRKNKTDIKESSKQRKVFHPMSSLTIEMIEPYDCKKPSFKKTQRTFEEGGTYFLDNENAIVVQNNILNETELECYITYAIAQERISGRSGFGKKPRYEVCYTPTGETYIYSGKKHFTKSYPEHVLSLIPKMQKIVDEGIGKLSPYRTLSNAVDIVYSPDFERGGSISRHKDDEMDWGLVIILTLGQSRWLRIRDEDGNFYNIKMSHNSIVCMHGKSFQQKYTHQVDKLMPNEPVKYRLSLNVRFLK